MTSQDTAQSGTPSELSDNAMIEDGGFIPQRAPIASPVQAPATTAPDMEVAESLQSVESAVVQQKKSHNYVDMSQFGLADPFAESVQATHKGGHPLTFAAPKARPGFSQRWVRFENEDGKPDQKNISKKIRQQGWKPRKASTVRGSNPAPTMVVEGGDAIIMTQGFILCEMPLERSVELKNAYESETNRQNVAVKANLVQGGEADRMNVQYESQESVDLGRKIRTVESADDE